MKRLKIIEEKEFILTDLTVKELHISAIACLEHDIYEGALVLAQAKLEKVIKRVLSAYARKEGFRTKEINLYMDSNIQSIDRLCNEGFKNFQLKCFSDVIEDNFKDSSDKGNFQMLWKLFKDSSKNVRNDTIHQNESNSPSFMVYSTKNIFYLTELIVKSCKNNINFPINPALNLNRQSIPKPKIKREILQKEKKSKKNYNLLKDHIKKYEEALEKTKKK